ncbi:MAG: L-aspartate oxidase [Myxococcota bacterium]
MKYQFDALVLGSGVAGLTYALRVAEHGRVAVVTKGERSETNTAQAQGGIAAVLDEQDSFEAHVKDTITAGAGLNDEKIVRICVREGPERIRELVELGVRFTREGDHLALTREGGHSARRIVHAKDMTGAAVQGALVAAVEEHPNIELFERHMAVDLITRYRLEHGGEDRVLGAYALDKETCRVDTFLAKVVFMATGGAGKVYLYTSNPDVASGDGVAMAWRAGAKVANMEFFQFHPTCLFHREAKSFLISEACRGEGGVLRRVDGTAFMANYHPLEDLAPRDVVARAIDNELKRSGDDHVDLDMTHLDSDFLVDRFPGIHEKLMEYGIDMRKELIPVVPAAHYCCGGVLSDEHGHSTVPGLFVAGEVACTGLHGANRLASNSLLEGLVFSHRAAAASLELLEGDGEGVDVEVPEWNPGFAKNPDENVLLSHAWDETRRLMWNYVGIVRSNRRLERARRRLDLLQQEIRHDYWKYVLTPDLVEVRNIVTVAMLIVRCALRRQESRGLHYNVDYPDTNDGYWLRDTVFSRGRGD